MLTNEPTNVRAIHRVDMKKQEHQQEREARKRRGLRRRLTVLALIAIAFSCVSMMTIHSQSVTLEEKLREKSRLEEQLKQLQEEEKRLQQEIENYNDLDYIAEIARRDYYLTKPGETLFKLPE